MKKIEFDLKVTKYGDSLVVVIPKKLADALKIEYGDNVSVVISDKHAVQN